MMRNITLLVSLVALGAACVGQSNAQSTPAPTVAATVAPVAIPPTPEAALPNFADLAAKAMPAVVSIKVEQHAKLSRAPMGRGDRDAPPFGFPFFGPGPMEPREREGRGLGSGFAIDASGIILTNAHVVEKADEIEVSFAQADGSERKLKATVLGSAPEYDVAVLKTTEPANAPTVGLGDSDGLRIGEWVMAIGNPFGLDHSVSVGIISAKERREIAPSGRRGLYDFLQTDASINPGNSGGPLLNTRGEVIGINAAVNAQGQGIGFAIPINMVKTLLPQLKKGEKFSRAWLGVAIQGLSDDLAKSYGLSNTRGALVAEVKAKSPAEDAGIKDGDVIVEFDGKKLNRSSDLPLYASVAGVGRKVPVTLFRDGKTRTVEVKLGAFPDEDEEASNDKKSDVGSGALGLAVRDLTPELMERLETQASKGAVVEGVEPGSPAAEAGLERGDVILGVQGNTIRSAAELKTELSKVKSGEIIRLKIERQGGRLYLALKKP